MYGPLSLCGLAESWRDASVPVKEPPPDPTASWPGKDPNAVKITASTSRPECTHSVHMFPFCLEGVMDFSYFVHLTDLTRYTSIEICVFIETQVSG